MQMSFSSGLKDCAGVTQKLPKRGGALVIADTHTDTVV